MADDNPIFQMVADPDFARMPVSEQRKALSAHDSSFGQVGDDDLTKFVQAHSPTHTGMPRGDVSAAHDLAAHTAPGTGTDAGSRMRQISGPPGALMNPREFLNMNQVTSTMGRRTPGIENVDPYTPLKEESNRRFAAGEPRGAAGMITDTADMASGMTTPGNLALMAAGPLTKALPAAGLITKPLMAGASALFGAEGGKDIYDAATDTEAEPADRVRKGLLGGAGVAGGIAGLGEIAPGPKTIGPIESGMGEAGVRGMFNKKMDIAAPNEPFTPRELFEGARDHGVNLDLADASGAGLPRTAKKYVSRSLGGANTFSNAQQGNVAALDQWGSDYLNKFSSYSGENAGARIQDSLKNDYAQRKNSASQEFEDLDKRVGPNTIDGTATVEAEALKIRDGMKQYYERHPELVPRQAWSIIEDLAERPTVTVKGPTAGNTQVPAKSNNFSWSELHQLRSDLMDIYRNNPDLVKSRADAWLQQMVKTIDDTMTGAASQLSPADKWQFRAANETWEGLKQTYDNPAHPLYHAVRAQQPSQVTNMLLNMKAPEFARQMKSVLGPEFGDLQRAAAERILGQDRTGAGYDFKSMPGRLKNYPSAYINDLLGPQAARDLRMMSRTGMTVLSNENPSGTSAVMVPAAEAGSIVSGIGTGLSTGHPLALGAAAIPPAEYAVARGMNSPRVVDHLTDPRTARAMPRGLPIAAGATTMNDAEDTLAQRLMRKRAEIAGP
jgi:hypothetical protein